MTVHQAKGKEFDSVVVAVVNEEAFPDNLEGRRLLYVALTRGRRQLVVIRPDRGQSSLVDCLR
jgi:superfamily I DNA/RNA helicase